MAVGMRFQLLNILRCEWSCHIVTFPRTHEVLSLFFCRAHLVCCCTELPLYEKRVSEMGESHWSGVGRGESPNVSGRILEFCVIAVRLEVKVLKVTHWPGIVTYWNNGNVLSPKHPAAVGFHLGSLHLFGETPMDTYVFHLSLCWVKYEPRCRLLALVVRGVSVWSQTVTTDGRTT